MQLNPLFMAQALYQLGKFDTFVDNGDGTTTITRQTGYYTKSTYTDYSWTPTDTTYGFAFSLPNYIGGAMGNAYANVETKTSGAWASLTPCFDPVEVRIYVPRDYTKPITIQYKLAEATTENVITGLSIANY